MKKPVPSTTIRSAHHELLAQKRTSGAGGRHSTRREKLQSKYPGKWKRGDE